MPFLSESYKGSHILSLNNTAYQISTSGRLLFGYTVKEKIYVGYSPAGCVGSHSGP